MRIRELHRETWVKYDPITVFEYFSDPSNLLKITPDNMSVELLEDTPIEMQEGTLIHLRMKLLGIVPVSWQTKIKSWDPPREFVDVQPRGPYRYWEHTHQFIEKEGGTLIIDHVEYAVPGFFLEPLIHYLFVRKNLERIFDYRQDNYERLIENKRNEG